MRILVICDSFKQSLTSIEVNQTIKEALINNSKDSTLEVDTKAISDGGEGFLDVISQNTSVLTYQTSGYDALNRPVDKIRYLYQNHVAYVELAEVVGIKNLSDKELSPFKTSTYGLGKVINEIIKKHPVKKIILGIGGSASTDAGSGMLEALGAKFYHYDQLLTYMDNEKLGLVTKVDFSLLEKNIKGISFTVLTDVINPLVGLNGAAFVFGKQKGATHQELSILDQNLKNYLAVLKEMNFENLDLLANHIGAGAAGGTGFGCLLGLKASISLGIDYLLELINYQTINKNYDLIITGEGSFDEQSLMGKVYQGIKKNTDTKVIVIAGINKTSEENVYSIVPNIASVDESMKNPKESLKKLIKQIIPQIIKK